MKKKITKGIITKLIAIGVIVILLLIGLACIKDKTWERERSFSYARSSINNAAGGTTSIKGFYIDVPYKETDSVEKWSNNEKHYETVVTHGSVKLEPDELVVSGNIKTEVRKVGIYSSPVYTGKVKINSTFDMNLKDYGIREYEFNKAKIYLIVGEDNLAARPIFSVNKTKYRTDYTTYDNHAAVIKTGISSKTGPLEISTELDICGAYGFEVCPTKGSTKMDITCDWPSPNFTNSSRLPVTREITDNGFTASWFVPFTKGADSSSSTSYIGFQYKDPVTLYDILVRAITYGFLFIIVPFLAFFLFEIFAKVVFHPVHYLLSGAACAVFFLLLLSFSEHINFNVAYVISAGLVGLLVSTYTGLISKKLKLGFSMFPILIILYGFLFVSLKSEDYALLLGSIFVFTIIAILMFSTHKVDWATIGKAKEAEKNLTEDSNNNISSEI